MDFCFGGHSPHRHMVAADPMLEALSLSFHVLKSVGEFYLWKESCLQTLNLEPPLKFKSKGHFFQNSAVLLKYPLLKYP